MTDAERQRRYRDKKRNAPTVTESVSFAPHGVTRKSPSVTRVTVEQGRNVTGDTLPDVDAVTPFGHTQPVVPLAEQPQPEHIQPVAVGEGVFITVGLDDYFARPDQYATRANPELLNWGKWMNSVDLEKAGLKANRVSIPGDWDYEPVLDVQEVTARIAIGGQLGNDTPTIEQDGYNVKVRTVSDEQPKPRIAFGRAFSWVIDKTVYGRKAVSYPHDQFDSRPEPLDHTDVPYPNNRGRYIRADGSVYQFDSGGQNFDCKFQFTGTDNKQHAAVQKVTA